MTLRQSSLNVAIRFCVCCGVAAGLALAGCSDTVPPAAPEMRAAQQEAAEKGVDQSARRKSGNTSGLKIAPKSVKSLIKKNAQE